MECLSITEHNGCSICDGTGCDHCFDINSGEFLDDVNLDENWDDKLYGDIN